MSTPFKVLLLDGVDAICAEIFAKRGIQADQPGKLDHAELLKILPEYSGMVVRSATTVTAEVLEHAPNMRVVGRAGVGVDNIDLKAATAKGVLVMNTPDGNTISTAEHTCGMILSLARNIPEAVASVKAGRWDRKSFMGSEVYGKTLGIIGLGKIGTEVALRMKSFGMGIVGYDPFASEEHADRHGIKLMDLDEVLGASDFLTVHTPLTEKTKGLISLASADKLKPGIRLVNCARGGIIQESDIHELLEKGIVGGVALDVFSSEPLTPELQEMVAHPAVISTPHLGASTEEAQEKVAEQIADQMADALENKGYKGSVNGKSIALLANDEVQPYLELAEKLGTLCGQLMPSNSSELTIEYIGEPARFSDLLTDGVLKGLLGAYITDTVNLINARTYATDRGLAIKEISSNQSETYRDLIRVNLGKEGAYTRIAATLFGEKDYRVVEIDKFRIELKMEGDMLMYQNQDVPGMLASVAGALASQNVNIGALSLGRAAKGQDAVTVLQIDKKLSDQEFEKVKALNGVRELKYFSLPE